MAASLRPTLANWGRKAKFEQLESRRMLDADQFEPNDSFAAATDFGIVGVIDESGLSIHESGNDDYYRITAAADGNIAIAIYFSHVLGDVDLSVYDVNQLEVDYSDSTSDQEFVTIAALQGDVFYVHVYGFSGATNPAYELEIMPDGGAGDSYEINDDFASASDLGSLSSFYESELSIHTADNDDYFQFTPSLDGDIDVSVYFGHDEGDIDLKVYDSNEVEIGASETVEDFESVFFSGLQGETYYIRVFGYDGATNPFYELEIIGTIDDPDLYEANDTFEDAYDLGSLGDFSDDVFTIHAPRNDDYYQFVAVTSGDYDVSVFFEHDLGDIDLELLDSAQSRIAISESTSDSESVLFSAVQGETYYVRVFGFASATNPEYELIIDGPALPPDAYEPNDVFTSAYDLGSLGNFSADDLSIHEEFNDDYFRFTAAATGDVDISIFFEYDFGDVDLAIHDVVEVLITSSTSTNDSEQVVISAVQGVTYYIRVYGYSGAINPDYDLVIESTPTGNLLGDYNTDTVVSAADYVLWRDTLGSTTNLAANGDDSNNIIDEDDYGVWVENFGAEAVMEIGASAGALQSPESSSSSAVAVSTYTIPNSGVHGSAILERGTKASAREISSSSQARMLALLDLLNSLPNSESESIPADWDVAGETEHEPAAREEAFSSYFAPVLL